MAKSYCGDGDSERMLAIEFSEIQDVSTNIAPSETGTDPVKVDESLSDLNSTATTPVDPEAAPFSMGSLLSLAHTNQHVRSDFERNLLESVRGIKQLVQGLKK